MEEDVRDRIREYVIQNTSYDMGGEQISSVTNEEIELIIDAFVNLDPEVITPDSEREPHKSIMDNSYLSEVYEKVRQQLEEEIAAASDTENYNAAMASDMFGGYTGNKLAGHNDYSGFYGVDTGKNMDGHPATYWIEDPKRAMLEGWAEFFDANLLNDKQLIANNRTMFPKGTAKMEEFAGMLYDYYVDYYTDFINENGGAEENAVD